jgi:hypothetical protein
MSWQEDLQQLDSALAAGQISADDYRLRRDEVLANAAQALPGGAQQQQQQPQQPAGPFPPPFRWDQPGAPAEATQVVRPGDAERTQVVRPGTPPQGVPQQQPPDSERTQYVRPVQPADADRTQVVQSGTPSGGFPAQIYPQQPPAPPAWQDASPPWGAADSADGGNLWANVQGPEVFEDSDSGGGKGRVIAILLVVLLVAGLGVGAYFLWGRGGGSSPADQTTVAQTSTSTPPPSPPPVRTTPDGPFVEVGKKDDTRSYKTLPIADAVVAKVPTFEEAQLLQTSGATDVRYAVKTDDAAKLSEGIWAFKSTNPAATLAALEQLYQAAQFELVPTSSKNVPVRHLPVTAANPIATYRGHYISTDFVVRVEAYGPDEAAAKLAFETLLKRQLEKFPAAG